MLVWCSSTWLFLLLLIVILMSYKGNHSQEQCHKAFLLCLLLLGFELVQFCVGFNLKNQLHSFVCGCPVFPIIFVDKTVFPFWAFMPPLSKIQFSSVTQSCPTLCNPMNHSTPGLPVHHQLPEFTQTHVHWVSDTIQPSHPRSSPSPPAPNPSQHQSLFQWVNSSHEVAWVLELQL